MFVTNVQRQEGRGDVPDLSKSLDLLGKMERNKGEYDETIAYALSLASAWSYSDPQTLQDAMNRLGFENRCYAITLSNQALFVQTSVLAWVKQQLPLVSWLQLPFSWDDHAPHRYTTVSQRSLRLHRSEFG